MSGVREVVETFYVPLDTTKDFRLDIPTRFLNEESHRDRIFDIWRNDVIPAINRLCRARESGFINRALKRSVFQSGMENVCKGFSRETDNINVESRQTEESNQYRPNRKTLSYSLIFTKLSPVATGLRETRYCVAEIPENPNNVETVEADFVATTDTVGTQASGSTSWCSVPSAYSEIVATSVPIGYQYDSYIDPPVAAYVRAMVDEDDDTQEPVLISDREIQRSALERMQELESIRMYLTESEYTAKRQSILDSI